MPRVGIVGGGSFGTALACVARRAGHQVVLWAREPDVAQAINAGRGNPSFLAGVAIEPGIAATADLGEAVDRADLVLMAVPAQFLRGIAERMRSLVRPGLMVVSCSKGIERGTCALMPELIAETLPQAKVAVLAGPSFAREVALGLTTGVTLAGTDRDDTERWARMLRSPRFQIFVSGDPISATIGGACKNVLAIACGIAIARRMGDNTKGLLLARGLYEMACLTRAKGGNPINLLGLAGSGDVMLTCMGSQSRNTTFGIALGAGRKPADILAERKTVTEGVHSAASITELGARLGVPVPIATAVHRIVNEGAAIDDAMAAMLAQPGEAELQGLR
jgi:glycerol-3-phosphate dehydrogenase (NAD(P)+)